MRTKDSAGLSGGILGQIEVSLETAAREGRAERAGEYQDQKGFMMDQTMNNDTEYLEAANAKLDAIEAWADEALPDADVSRQGNVLTLQLEGGNEIVLNLQTPWHEIWLASRLGGYHFRERDGVWHDTRTDATLEEKLEEAVKALTA